MVVKYPCFHAGICDNIFSKAHDGRKYANGFMNYGGCIFLNKIGIYSIRTKTTFSLTSFENDSLNVYANANISRVKQKKRSVLTVKESEVGAPSGQRSVTSRKILSCLSGWSAKSREAKHNLECVIKTLMGIFQQMDVGSRIRDLPCPVSKKIWK